MGRNAAASADLTQAASMEELQVQLTCCKRYILDIMPVTLMPYVHAISHSIAVSSGMRSAAQI